MKQSHFLAFAIVLSVQTPLATARCLPTPDSAPSSCRYPAGDTWCSNHDRPNPYAFSDQCLARDNPNAAVRAALQNELSIEGAKIQSIDQIVQDSPNNYSVDFSWSIDGSSFQCTGSVATNSENQITQASIPYVCYREYMGN